MKKSYWIVVGVGFCILLLLGGLNSLLTMGAEDSARQFLKLVSQGRVEEAYNSTAEAYRKELKRSDFEELVKRLKLSEYQSADWSRTYAGDLAVLSGYVSLTKGRQLPLMLKLTKEAGGWRIFSIGTPAEGIQHFRSVHGGVDGFRNARRPSGPALGMPDKDESPKLASAALLALDQAVKTDDFTAFREGLSSQWKAEIAPDRLKRAFRFLLEQRLDLSGVQTTPPKDLETRMDDDSLLRLSGEYQLDVWRVRFRLTYIPDDGQWKLFGIRVDADTPDEG